MGKPYTTPSWATVLIGGGLAGAVTSVVLTGAIWGAYVLHHQTPATVSGVVPNNAPVPVSAPVVRTNPTLPSADSQTKQPPILVRMRPLSFAPLVRRVIPAVVNISTDDPEEDEAIVKGAELNKASAKEIKSDSKTSKETKQKDAPKDVKKDSKDKDAKDSRDSKDSKDAKESTTDDDSSSDEVTSMGSGFIVDPSGIIVTNAHVVNPDGVIHVSLSDGRVLQAKLLGTDPMTDIAVLKVSAQANLPYVRWGRSSAMQIGDWVVAAGNPFGFGSSITAGIVSAVGRDLGLGDLDDFMQFDAPINPGNSGGPAFNMRGEVIAMNAAIATPNEGSVGIGFGIPSDLVAPIVAQIEKTGTVSHGWIGVTLDDVSGPVRIVKLDKNGSAYQAGLREGDELLALEGEHIQTARSVLRSVGLSAPDVIFAFKIKRGDRELGYNVKLGSRPVAKTPDSSDGTDEDT